MKKSILNLTVLTLVSAAFAGQAFANATATQTVSYEVAGIDEITVAGSPSLVVNSAVAGSAPTIATAAGTYAITTNQDGRKITAQINSNMPANVTLSLNATAPSFATSSPVAELSTTPQDLVTGISKRSESGLSLGYSLSATAAAGVVPAGNKTVTLTITAGA